MPKVGDRFYARVHSADVACPACGTLIRFGRGATHSRAYTPGTSRLQCPSCKAPFIVGLVCWPIAPGGYPAHRATRPADQIPGPRERVQLREMAGGWWARETRSRYREQRPTNATGPVCTCTTGKRPERGCPLHGDD